jgi:hypothetical protein
MLIIPAHWRLIQDDLKFQCILGYTVSSEPTRATSGDLESKTFLKRQKTSIVTLQKLKHRLIELSNPISYIYSNELKKRTQKHICTFLFIPALSLRAKKWKTQVSIDE